ncbi:MAG: DUF456 domain-containing protein [Bacteroidetes bacterium]|nr:DUF456 domain-containing protein [Bacteroidota bacterium]
MGDSLLLIAGILMVLVGVAGIIVPGLPGVVLVYLGLFFVAWSDGFARVGWITLTLLLLLGAVAWVIDMFTTVYGARRIGASRWAALGASIGMFIGLWFGLPGIVFGPFIGALGVELLVRKDLVEAGKAGLGTWLGLLVGTALKLALIFSMIGIFLIAYIF